MEKHVLVTGAGGYIGRHVVHALCNMGVNVTAVSRHNGNIDPRAQILVRDIFKPSQALFRELGSPDVCVHLAWQDGFVHNSDTHMASLSSHYKFLEQMLQGGLKQLVVMGTMHEVGYFEGAIDADTPCNPINMYGIAKDALRRSTTILAQKYDTCLQWLRAYYIYGDDKNNHSIFTKIVQAEQAGEAFFPLNSGRNKYDFIEIDVLANQIAYVAMQTKIDGIINCCSGVPTSLGEKVEKFIEEHHYSIRPKYNVFDERPYDSPEIWGNPEKIRRIMLQVSESGVY